ncbi:N-acetylmuramate alpha-1-phosphate uridylyltransferase MurU [Aquabacterium sp.]|uniref:N-acetylmuramate alpha-1-phosphate uridylyltransferase MurU n=1 Tax=Aquabacterium sp. TaxID=1872578 RepID=UPI002C2A9D00|nr:adenosylmethionine decarboxylase [Aquabacterium sp.]HSW07867.1 adenosylmethionine decarboxylase [Aquabacterium sp.]
MQGLHLTADLSGCPPTAAVMTDAAALRALCLAAVAEAGLTAVGELFHRFTGGPGITGVVLLAESHLAVHTWPELAAVTLDVYVCNFGADNSAKADALLLRLEAAFGASSVARHRLQRGRAAASAPRAPVAGNLKALIFAAGRGERMRPLTDHIPKPLLPVHGKPMIEWHLEALARDGVQEVVINTAWLEEQFPDALGDGSRWGLRIHYSMEGRDHGGALETAGGIAKALPWLGDCFWIVSGDVVTPQFRFDVTIAQRFATGDDDAHLWLLPNPGFNAAGDFALQGDRVLREADPRPLTYANIALVRRRLVDGITPGQHARLNALLFASAAAGRLGGELLSQPWHNLGTPEQLADLNRTGGA